MNCKEYAKWQSQYVDGDVDAATDKEIREHLSACPSCRRLYEEAKTLLQTLRGIDDIEIPENLEAEIFRAVKKGPRKEKEGFRIPKFLRAWQFYSVPAACLLIYTVLYGLSGANLPGADETLVYTTKPPEKIHSFLPTLPAAWPFQPQETEEPVSEPVTPAKRTTGLIVAPQHTQEKTAAADIASSPVAASPEAASAPAPATPSTSFSIAGGRIPSSSTTQKPGSSGTNAGNEPSQNQASAKTYPTVSSLVKRAITFVVDDTNAAAVFERHKNSGEQAVRNALSRAGFDFTTRESIAEEFASSYNALAEDATTLAARIAKGETALSALLSEKEFKMQTMREDCATPTLRLAYQ